MLNILGSKRRLCNGLTRRDFVRVGGLGLAGMSLADMLAWREASAATDHPRSRSFGKAKSVILLHLYGSPSQIEWVDPKPDAPREIRGDFGCIPSSLPGLQVCELFPNMAKVMDRCTTIRSMSHPYPIHGVAYALTGVPTIDVPMELSPRDPRHWPFFGSVVDYVEARRRAKAGESLPSVPTNIALPWPMSTQREGEVPRAGPYAAFLGSQYDPVWTQFRGEATAGYIKTLRQTTYTGNDPYVGVAPDSYFEVPAATSLQPEMTLDRLARRRGLLEQLDRARADLERTAAGEALDRHRASAFDLLKSTALRDALDLRREDRATRDMYGQSLFGQGCLAARRLVEAGSRVVTVFWDEYGLAGSGWDTHWDHFGRMKNELAPGFDRAWYGLITDLDQRGMLDDTLVVCTSEHGRTPKISNIDGGGGRGHWSRAYSTLVAGGGTKRGSVYGATDKDAGEVVDLAMSPKDLLATMYHLLGIDHHQLVYDTLDRPLPLVDGKVVEGLLA